MKKAVIQIDCEAEALLEEWLWFQDAQAVITPADHVADRRVEAFFENADETALAETLKRVAGLWPGRIHSLSWEAVPDHAWEARWREGFQPITAGRFQVVGEWEKVPDAPRVIRVYPGAAFGTGHHETTRLMLEHLEGTAPHGKRVLDIGCGTGILAIAAERLGAAQVFGFDADPGVEENMLRHLHINRTRRATLRIGKLGDFSLQPFDIVLANITLNVLREVWPDLPPLMKPGAVALFTGILEEQAATAATELERLGFQASVSAKAGEWVLFEARLA